MSNPLGSNDSTDQPDPKKPEQSSTESKGEEPLNISDLMSINRPPYSQTNANKDDTSNFKAADGTKFDGQRMNDISKLLNDGLITRDPSTRNNQQAKDFTTKLDANANMGLTFPMGMRQFFTPRGVDVKSIEEQKELEDKKNRFVKDTPLKDESILSEAEHKNLIATREALLQARTVDDIVSNSLHLTRLYLHLQYIEEARKALGLALSADPKSVLANQLFQELERVHPQDIAFSPITTQPIQLSKAALARRIIDLARGRIIVVGDLLIDELLEGKPTRISREAPVLILEHAETVLIPGGAANTAHNITALGGACHAIGVCGNDEYATKLEKLLESHRISHDLVRDPDRPTTVKSRILSKSHSLMQQLLRIDRISHDKVSESIARQVAGRLAGVAGSYQAIILSDYKAGVIVDTVVEACRDIAQDKKIMLIVDAQNDFERFAGATVITPNQPDAEGAVGYKIDSAQALEKAGSDLLSKSKAEAVLLTRGGEGMALFRRHHSMVELPPFNKHEVFDVTGAGDTVVATMALALVTGASFVEAMALGNLAAGIVVKKSGTAVTSQKEMLDTLESIDLPAS